MNFFNYESGIMSAINKVADTLILSVLWVLCSLPVFTVGASSAAFYYAYQKCVRQRTDYAVRTFFTGFRSNFKQAATVWLVVLGLSVVAVADWYLLSLMKDTSILIPIIQAALLVVMAAIVIWALYLFPYLSRFENTTKTILKNCALIAIANLPRSILLLVLFFLCGVGFVSFPLLNLLIPALYIACANRILESIFQKYMPSEESALQESAAASL